MPTIKQTLQRWLHLAGVEENATTHWEKLLSALGAFVGIATVYWVSRLHLDQTATLTMTASMGASAVLLFAIPHGTLSQPWPVAAGHLVSASIGMGCATLLQDSVWAPPLAVGGAVGAMYYLRCIHPPGGATALTAVIGGDAVQALGFSFLLFPVSINVASIMAAAMLFNSPFKWRRYPGHFASRERKTEGPQPDKRRFELSQEDFAAAMHEINSFIDVTSDDLIQLFELAAIHAEQNAVHPSTIVAGHYYSNGQLGQQWSIRQVIDVPTTPPAASDKLIYKIVAGDGAFDTGVCPFEDFRLWARFEVVPSNGHWLHLESQKVLAPDETSY